MHLQASRSNIKTLSSISQVDVWKHLPEGQGLSDILYTIDFTKLVASSPSLGPLSFFALIEQISHCDTGY